jgi:hypothetical protein
VSLSRPERLRGRAVLLVPSPIFPEIFYARVVRDCGDGVWKRDLSDPGGAGVDPSDAVNQLLDSEEKPDE